MCFLFWVLVVLLLICLLFYYVFCFVKCKKNPIGSYRKSGWCKTHLKKFFFCFPKLVLFISIFVAVCSISCWFLSIWKNLTKKQKISFAASYKKESHRDDNQEEEGHRGEEEDKVFAEKRNHKSAKVLFCVSHHGHPAVEKGSRWSRNDVQFLWGEVVQHEEEEAERFCFFLLFVLLYFLFFIFYYYFLFFILLFYFAWYAVIAVCCLL